MFYGFDHSTNGWRIFQLNSLIKASQSECSNGPSVNGSLAVSTFRISHFKLAHGLPLLAALVAAPVAASEPLEAEEAAI